MKLPRLPDPLGRAWAWFDTVATGCDYPKCKNKIPPGGGHYLPDLDYKGCDDHPLPAHEVEAMRRELEATGTGAADMLDFPRNGARARRRRGRVKRPRTRGLP